MAIFDGGGKEEEDALERGMLLDGGGWLFLKIERWSGKLGAVSCLNASNLARKYAEDRRSNSPADLRRISIDVRGSARSSWSFWSCCSWSWSIVVCAMGVNEAEANGGSAWIEDEKDSMSEGYGLCQIAF